MQTNLLRTTTPEDLDCSLHINHGAANIFSIIPILGPELVVCFKLQLALPVLELIPILANVRHLSDHLYE